MKKKRGIKTGIIGAGVMGQHHVRICSSLPGVNLVAVSDINEHRLHEIGQQYAILSFLNYHEMLPLIDAVIIASPSSSHFEVGNYCLQAGKHSLVEKPLAQTAEEGAHLVALAKEKRTILACGFIERFNPAFQELPRLIKKEKIIGIDIKRLSPFPERISDADVIQDMMIHDLDLLNSLLPLDELEEVKAEGKRIKTGKFDQVDACFYFKSGAIARIAASRVFSDKARKIVVTTENNVYEADLLNKKVFVRDLVHISPSVHFVKNIDQLTAELTDFMKSIKEKTCPRVDGEAGLKALKIMEEVYRACL